MSGQWNGRIYASESSDFAKPEEKKKTWVENWLPELLLDDRGIVEARKVPTAHLEGSPNCPPALPPPDRAETVVGKLPASLPDPGTRDYLYCEYGGEG